MYINSYEDFKRELRNVCLEKYGINVFSLQKQVNDSFDMLEKAEAFRQENCQNILVKNMQELYQDYLINNTPPSVYINRLADEYKYLLDYTNFESFREQCFALLKEKQLSFEESASSRNILTICAANETRYLMDLKQIYKDRDIEVHPDEAKEVLLQYIGEAEALFRTEEQEVCY